jgi:hypothetical protein
MLSTLLKVVALTVFLSSCGWLTQKTEVGDNSSATVNQQQDQSEGAKVASGVVDDIVTNNTDGIPVYWFLIGGIVMGILIPQPKWMKLIW